VRHSLSPALHNAGYEALGLDWVYVAFEVPAGGAPAALEAMRALGLGGLNVTMPHKSAVAEAVDRLTPTAAALGAVNTVVPEAGHLVGDSTDGPGFLASLADAGFDPAGTRCLVLGAGGAARAVVHALGTAGALVEVAARREDAAIRAAELATGRVVSSDAAEGADLVVNATPVGMVANPGLPVDPDRLGPGQLVVDLVYQPRETELLVAARARGAATADGVGMLVHQAALAFRAFTGEDPPLDALRAAVAVNSPS
jgi:shikimate dehydrogenase